jgi:hypothetical protein
LSIASRVRGSRSGELSDGDRVRLGLNSVQRRRGLPVVVERA